MIFQRISDSIRHILGDMGISVHNYIDDIFAAEEADYGKDSLRAVCELIRQLGLPLNEDKVQGPSKVLTIMGIEIDVERHSLAIPTENLDEIVEACEEVHTKGEFTKRQLQSLLRKHYTLAKSLNQHAAS